MNDPLAKFVARLVATQEARPSEISVMARGIMRGDTQRLNEWAVAAAGSDGCDKNFMLTAKILVLAFASHRLHGAPEGRSGASLGRALGSPERPYSEDRMGLLLKAKKELLPRLLPSALRWLKSKGQPLDYYRLARDVHFWDHVSDNAIGRSRDKDRLGLDYAKSASRDAREDSKEAE